MATTNINEMRKAAEFVNGRHDHYLRVKLASGRTVLLRVTGATKMLSGEEVTMRDGDIGLGVYGVVRDGAEQVNLIMWEMVAWVKVVEFDWYEGKLNEVAV